MLIFILIKLSIKYLDESKDEEIFLEEFHLYKNHLIIQIIKKILYYLIKIIIILGTIKFILSNKIITKNLLVRYLFYLKNFMLF